MNSPIRQGDVWEIETKHFKERYLIVGREKNHHLKCLRLSDATVLRIPLESLYSQGKFIKSIERDPDIDVDNKPQIKETSSLPRINPDLSLMPLSGINLPWCHCAEPIYSDMEPTVDNKQIMLCQLCGGIKEILP